MAHNIAHASIIPVILSVTMQDCLSAKKNAMLTKHTNYQNVHQLQKSSY